MVKVGILSMQRICNYGSFLQAYALKRILEEMGCEVCFVDYHPGPCLVASAEGWGLKRKARKALAIFKTGAPLPEKIKFINYKRKFAGNYLSYLGITDERNYSPEIDVLVIGSDEVFNCVQDNTNVGFCPELFGAGSKAKRMISYAASFGNTTMEKLRQYHIEKEVAGWLDNFESISVRDANSGSIVETLTGKSPQEHLDPVLIYDFMGKCEEIHQEIREKDFLILYGYSGRFTGEECLKIREYADRKRLKIFCIGGIQDCCDRFIDCSPFDVIAWFDRADCIITDTFHGAILSVITHKQFAVFVRDSGYGNAEKLCDLLARLGLKDRRIRNADELSQLILKPVDYMKTDETIRKERIHAAEYLKTAILRDTDAKCGI